MLLYHSPTSPYVRTVMIVLHESGALNQVELVPASGTAIDPGTAPIEINPLGKVPTLVVDDSTALYDSRTICRYLADRFHPTLYSEGEQLWPVLTLEAAANGMMDAAYLMVMEGRLRPKDKQFAPWVEGQWAKIDRALTHLEAQVSSAPLTGPLNMAQIGLVVALGYIDLRLGDRGWRTGRPNLTAWEAEMAQRPSVQETRPPTN